MNDTTTMIEQRASAAPRVTPADIEAAIVAEHYFTAADGVLNQIGDEWVNNMESEEQLEARIDAVEFGPLNLLTFCVLVLRNGFTVTGESACVSPENFDAAIGRRVARENAVEKIWPLLGYALKDKLAGA